MNMDALLNATLLPMTEKRRGVSVLANGTVELVDLTADDCDREQMRYLRARFVLVAVLGTSLALAGAACNAFLCYIFGLRLARRSQFLFFVALAFFELNIDLSYICVFPVRLVAEVTDNRRLFILWYSYLPFVYTWAHVSMTSGSFMIVAASVDRCVQHFRREQFTASTRGAMIGTAFFVALLIKGAMLVENRIVWNAACEGTWAEVSMDLADFVYRNPWYFQGVMFWGRHICHVFLPFVVLVLLHAAMLYSAMSRARGSLARTLVLMAVQPAQQSTGYDSPVTARRSSARAARRMLCAVVTTYVSTHTLNVLITSWEFIDLQSIQNLPIYPFLTDTVSLLTIVCSLSRLPIYYTLNADVRADVKPRLRALFGALLLTATCGARGRPKARRSHRPSSARSVDRNELVLSNVRWRGADEPPNGAEDSCEDALVVDARAVQNGHLNAADGNAHTGVVTDSASGDAHAWAPRFEQPPASGSGSTGRRHSDSAAGDGDGTRDSTDRFDATCCTEVRTPPDSCGALDAQALVCTNAAADETTLYV